MRTMHLDRRTFVAGAAAAILGAKRASAAAAGAAEETRRPAGIRLGGPVTVGADDPEAFARAHRALSYRAAYCPNLPVKDADRIRALAAACAKHDVAIAEVGRWVNLLDADPEKRKQNLALVIDGLALAEAVGARCCVDIAGSFNRDVWFGPHPENLTPRFFDAAVENARAIIDAVAPKRAKFCYEMMGWALPDSADSYLAMLKAVDRPAFGVHLDPCNLVNSPARFYRNADLLGECFEKLGPWIASCHAKDLRWEVEMNVHFLEVRPGAGAIDYGTYLRRLARLPQGPPLMLEHLPNAEEYDKARRWILGAGAEAGVTFE